MDINPEEWGITIAKDLITEWAEREFTWEFFPTIIFSDIKCQAGLLGKNYITNEKDKRWTAMACYAGLTFWYDWLTECFYYWAYKGYE